MKEIDQEEAFMGGYQFKGKDLYPFTQGRMRSAFSIGVRMGSEQKATIGDILAIIFICMSEPKVLSRTHRDPDGFWEAIDAWADANVRPEDYEEAGNVARAILEEAFGTKAEPLAEEGEGLEPGLGGESGN